MLQAGAFIKSTAALNDTVFEGAIIFITEYNAGGAVGFIINKRFDRQLNELVEFNSSPSFPLYGGGPVDKEHLFFIHRRPDLVEEGISITNGIYNGGNFKQAMAAINDRTLSTADIKIFVGYCGWDASELEGEIEEGSWEVAMGEDVFMS